MKILGFTGTRNGMTLEQKGSVRDLLFSDELKGYEIGLHGDCIGADDDFNTLCRESNRRRQKRPCTFENMRANSDAEQIAEAKPPMQRNRDIVADAKVMIACPPNFIEIKKGSGTWATIRFARRAGKPIYLVYPDGNVALEGKLDNE